MRIQTVIGAGAAALALALSLAAAGAASAEDAPVPTAKAEAPPPPVDPREAKIEALEAQVQALAAQIADLKSQVTADIKTVKTAQAAQPQVTLANGRPQIASADGDFKFALRSVVQFDAAHYSVDPLRTDNDLASGTNFRRVRVGFDATVWRDWNIAFLGEFGGSGGESAILNQAYLEYAGFKPGGVTTRLRVGAWANPTGLEDATSNSESLFLERPAAAELVRGIAGGDGRSAVGAFFNGKHWYASAVLSGAVVGTPSTPEFDEQSGYMARIALNPLHGPDYDVHVGANIQGILSPADTAAGPLTAQAVRLRERPELRVDGSSTRLVDTGSIPSDGLVAYGGEFGAAFRNLYLQAEAFRINVSRTGVSPFDPSFDGWYVQGSWALTGERHQWSSATGGFRGLKPSRNFDPKTGGWGALELAGRYSVLDLNDQAGAAGTTTPVGGVRGGRQAITSVAADWYPNSVIRFLLEYQWVNVDRLSSTGTDIGENVDILSARAQFAF